MKKHSLLVIILSVIFITPVVFAQGQNWKNEISSNYFYIKAAESDKYWDLPGSHPNTARRDLQFQLYSFKEEKYERTFTFPYIRGTDYFAIINRAGYIVDVGGKEKLNVKEKVQKKTGKKFKMKTDNGVEIQTWDKSPDGVPKWQQWKLLIVDKNTVIFENVFTRKAIDMRGGGDNIKKNGTKLISYDRNNSAAQRFQLIYAEGPKEGEPLNFEE